MDYDPYGSHPVIASIDRLETAQALQAKGIDISAEDWVGYCDESVLEGIANLLYGSEIDMHEVIKEQA